MRTLKQSVALPAEVATGGVRPRPLARRASAGSIPLLALLAACVTTGPVVDSRSRDLRHQPAPRSLPVPVVGVAKANLRNSYGDPRSGGRKHEGIDIFARRSTPVMAATEGFVSRLGTGGLGGIVVWVTGPAGWRHYYAHLERWGSVREGDWVDPGTIIGYVGNTGNAASTPSHLHYGIYPPGGGTLNPYPLLASGPGPAIARQPGSAAPPTRTARRVPQVPPEVGDAARRRAAAVSIAILREVLEKGGGGN